jgi:hypothetical protein
LIDGIGIFPNQEKELIEMNASEQTSHAADLLAKIPQHIKVFIEGMIGMINMVMNKRVNVILLALLERSCQLYWSTQIRW